METATQAAGREMERLDETSLAGRVNVPAPEAWIERLDVWRVAQRPIASRAEAVRKLVSEALDARERAPQK